VIPSPTSHCSCHPVYSAILWPAIVVRSPLFVFTGMPQPQRGVVGLAEGR